MQTQFDTRTKIFWCWNFYLNLLLLCDGFLTKEQGHIFSRCWGATRPTAALSNKRPPCRLQWEWCLHRRLQSCDFSSVTQLFCHSDWEVIEKLIGRFTPNTEIMGKLVEGNKKYFFNTRLSISIIWYTGLFLNKLHIISSIWVEKWWVCHKIWILLKHIWTKSLWLPHIRHQWHYMWESGSCNYVRQYR